MRQGKKRTLRYLKLRDKCAALIQGGLVAFDGVPQPLVIVPGTAGVDDIQAMDAYRIAQLVLDLGEGHSGSSIRLAARLVAAYLSLFNLTSDQEALEHRIRSAYRGVACLFRERRRLEQKERNNG